MSDTNNYEKHHIISQKPILENSISFKLVLKGLAVYKTEHKLTFEDLKYDIFMFELHSATNTIEFVDKPILG